MSENGKKYTYKDNFLNFKTLKFEGGLKDPHFKIGGGRLDADKDMIKKGGFGLKFTYEFKKK